MKEVLGMQKDFGKKSTKKGLRLKMRVTIKIGF